MQSDRSPTRLPDTVLSVQLLSLKLPWANRLCGESLLTLSTVSTFTRHATREIDNFKGTFPLFQINSGRV